MNQTVERAPSTYRKIIRYKRLTWGRAAAVAGTALLWALFLSELPSARNTLEENLRDQMRIALFVSAVLAVLETRLVILMRHAEGEDLYEAGALPAASPWPAVVATVLAALIGAAAAALGQLGG
jgi:hypothetical protein